MDLTSIIKLSETKDYDSLVPFFIENELEFSEEEPPITEEIVKLWRITEESFDEEGTPVESRIIGGFVLALRQGEYICDGIAIDPEYRMFGYGKELLDRGIEEVRSLGGERMFLVARAPGFFARSGFVAVEREDAPEFFECLTCPQYGVDCHPEVMRLDI